MGLVAVAEAEGAGQVASEESLLLDGGEDGLVNGLLVASASAGNNLLLLMEKNRYISIIRPLPQKSDSSRRKSPTTGVYVHIPGASLPA